MTKRMPVALPSPLAELLGTPPAQVALVVPDLDVALEHHAGRLGLGPWACFTYTPELLTTATYRGRPARFSLRLALAAGTPEVELIEPLDGPSVYHDHLETHGAGVHHFAYVVPSIDRGVATMEHAGYPLVQLGAGFGLDGDGAFAYFDTVADFGVMLELRELPRRRRAPERIVEAGAA
jgi:methylmalonyl-CoA/ethylmalonyl-CoA epimerase